MLHYFMLKNADDRECGRHVFIVASVGLASAVC